jgi:hypothetical protein
MMERLLAKITAIQEKVVTHHEKSNATLRGMRAGQVFLKAEMLPKLDAHHERMMSKKVIENGRL